MQVDPLFSFQVGAFPRKGSGLAAGAEGVVPVVQRGSEALDVGMASVHPLGEVLAGGVRVEAAADGSVRGQQCGEPAGIGSGAGGGEAA